MGWVMMTLHDMCFGSRVLWTSPGHKDRQLPSKQTLVAKIPGTRGDSWNLAFLRPKDAETSPGRRSPRGNRLASAPQCPERRQSPTQTLLLLPPQPGVGNRRGLHAYDSERRRDSSARDTKPDLDPRSRQKCSMKACLVSRSRQKCPTEASLDTRPLPCQVEASLDACSGPKSQTVTVCCRGMFVAIAHGAHVVFVVLTIGHGPHARHYGQAPTAPCLGESCGRIEPGRQARNSKSKSSRRASQPCRCCPNLRRPSRDSLES